MKKNILMNKNSCIISISKIKVLNGLISEGFPKMKVYFLVETPSNKLVSCHTIINYNEDLSSISDELARIFI